jgi:hypothetical protein
MLPMMEDSAVRCAGNEKDFFPFGRGSRAALYKLSLPSQLGRALRGRCRFCLRSRV